MIMNTQQLQYLIEIERTRSISQAAANLYMGQPNLSRVLRETEAGVGFPIFERTRKGVRPTEKGAVFLQHARNILREADFMERMGPNSAQPNRFRVCLPRSCRYIQLVQEYLCSQDHSCGLDAMIRECHPRQALELLDSGSAEIAVIRYCTEYQDYFTEQSTARELSLHLLPRVKYTVVTRSDSPLARIGRVSRADLESCTELMHRDSFVPVGKDEPVRNQIYTVDRMAQLQLLHAMPNTYLWSEPLPAAMLDQNGLVQLPCSDGGLLYQDAMVYKPQCAMSDIEKGFIAWINGMA